MMQNFKLYKSYNSISYILKLNLIKTLVNWLKIEYELTCFKSHIYQ